MKSVPDILGKVFTRLKVMRINAENPTERTIGKIMVIVSKILVLISIITFAFVLILTNGRGLTITTILVFLFFVVAIFYFVAIWLAISYQLKTFLKKKESMESIIRGDDHIV